VRGTGVCLSSLLAAERHQELLEVLTLQRFPFWHDSKFGMQALISDGRIEEALAYAESSRGLNQPDLAIDAACEKMLLDVGRVDEAYDKYALTANGSSTGLTTFRALVRKYPDRDPKKILLDLARSSDEPGRWFAAAKDAGFLDLALEFANTGHTDPRTLSRASRDFLKKDARFCLDVGRLAIRRILEGYGYEMTGIDVLDAFSHYMAAAQPSAWLRRPARIRSAWRRNCRGCPVTFSFASARLSHRNVRRRLGNSQQGNLHGQDETWPDTKRQTHCQEHRWQDEASLAAEGREYQECNRWPRHDRGASEDSREPERA
jgi:hypothetical protein